MTVARTLATIACGALLLAGCAGDPPGDPGAPTPASPGPTPTTDTDAEIIPGQVPLQVGQCLVVESFGEGLTIHDYVVCEEPHNAEVYFEITAEDQEQTDGRSLGELQQQCQELVDSDVVDPLSGNVYALPQPMLDEPFDDEDPLQPGGSVFCIFQYDEDMLGNGMLAPEE